ncbi:hypothetical protein NM208_g14804 [Fusarium decemcellulare]|uniref:Uncharacterized protein n=1 Tax=Fusarium decemcellulare TaxID=57161 RepID=A0ACC1RGP9_9HYPO|nr:hypothetical protein NM208_g14804 [Fusarium decemcellulare]
MTSTKEPVAFIGLGAMGYGMATQLVTQGYPLTGFDISAPILQKLQEAGGKVASSPAEAVQNHEYCVCMVATAQQAEDVLLGGANPAVPALAKNAALLVCSTVPCGFIQDLERRIQNSGRSDILLVDCPVSGGAIRAADGTLSIMAGGSAEAISKGRDLLQALSDPEKLYIVEGGIGAGSNMKMCHQVLAANQILSSSESLGFAHHQGLDLAQTSKALVSSQGWSWMLENRLPRILDATRPIASAVTIILKDTSIITSEARRYGFPTPMTSTAEQGYFVALGKGYGRDDDGTLIRIYTEGERILGQSKNAPDDEAKTKLVIDLLKGIHACAATEALAFAHKVGLDLDQVFELCINAAGGSSMLKDIGSDIIRVLRGGQAEGKEGLVALVKDLERAVDEAQRLKLPLFLGTQALNMIQLVLRHKPKDLADVAIAQVVKAWVG